MKDPKDLGVVIGTKAQTTWINVKANVKIEIERAEEEMLVNKALLELAEKKIKEEKDKMKEERKKEKV